MKVIPLLTSFLWMAACALRAAVSISGTGAITQNFDSLGTGSVAWSQGVTVNSWHLHRSATTPPITLTASNGSGSFAGNAYNLGVSGAADRALGTAATTSHGNYSRVLILRNTSATALQITRVSYAMEVYRTNQFLTTQEAINFSWQAAATEAALTSPLTTAGNLAGYTADAALSMNVVFTGPGMPAVAGQVAPPVALTRSAAPAAPILVNPGQYVALRWEDINESNSSDAYLGLDDVTVEYRPLVCLVTPQALSLARNDNGTPPLLTDDTWGFSLRVTGVAVGSQGWSAPALGISGAYGGSAPLTYPIDTTSQTILVRDVQFPDCTAEITVNAPPPGVAYVLPDRPQSITFDPAPIGARTYTRTLAHPDLSWFWSDTSTATGVAVQPGTVPGAPKYFDFNASNDGFPLVSEDVNTSLTGGAVKVTVRLAAYTTSDSGMESDDEFRPVAIASDTPNGPALAAVDLLPEYYGAAAFNLVRITDPGINYGSAGVPFPATPFPFREFSGYLPAGTGAYARTHITGLNDSNNEHWLVDSMRFEKAACDVLVQVMSVDRTHPLSQPRDPSGDVFTARLAITNPVPGPAGRWVAGAQSGPYGPLNTVSNQHTLGPWPVSGGPVAVTIADADDPGCFKTITIAPPPRLVFGSIAARGITDTLCTGGGHQRWTSQEDRRTLHMESATYSATGSDRNAVFSLGVPLPGSGLLYVTGIIEAEDTSTGSNFENSDFVRVEAICSTPAGGITIPLLVRYDKDGNGDITGYGQGGGSNDLIDYMANIHRDELNRSRRHYSQTFTERMLVYGVLPADTYYLNIRLEGRTGGNNSISNSEFLSLSDLHVTSMPPRMGVDWDSDGQPDMDEFFTGTDPFDPLSLTRFQSAAVTSANGNFFFNSTVPTEPGVFYGLYTSPDLTNWYLVGPPLSGDGTVKALDWIDDEPASHTFFKVIARPGNDFPPVLP